MNAIVKVIVVIVCVWLIMAFLIPYLPGLIGQVVTILVVVGCIVGLMKLAGIWF